MRFSTLTAPAALFAVTAALAAPALAVDAVGLTGERDLVWIDSSKLATTGSVTVTGGEGRLLGIDVRPADGKLYGVFADGTVATLDPVSGVATKVSTLAVLLPEGVAATVEFNPAADRLRVMGSDGTSLRVNVDSGEVTEDGRHSFAADSDHAGQTPNVIAGAYTNSYKGTEATQLLNIDAIAGALLLQAPPNDGVLNAVGMLGIEVAEAGFDIKSDGAGGNEAWLLSGGTLYAVNLETGMASEVGTIEGTDLVRDLAILPAQ